MNPNEKKTLPTLNLVLSQTSGKIDITHKGVFFERESRYFAYYNI